MKMWIMQHAFGHGDENLFIYFFLKQINTFIWNYICKGLKNKEHCYQEIFTQKMQELIHDKILKDDVI
jgi:tryptophan-rich sensory protein